MACKRESGNPVPKSCRKSSLLFKAKLFHSMSCQTFFDRLVVITVLMYVLPRASGIIGRGSHLIQKISIVWHFVDRSMLRFFINVPMN